MAEKISFDNIFDFKWTNRNETFASVIGQMYEDEEQLDLIIKLNGDKQLGAHRHVMAIVSPKFMELLEEELDDKGNFVTATSEVELPAIPYHVMKKVLKYIYYGTVDVGKMELRKFCNVVSELGIATFYDTEIKGYLKKMKTTEETAEMVYHGRGLVLAEGFESLFYKYRMFDITVEVQGLPIQAHRIALSVGSSYFKGLLNILPPTTAGTKVTPQVNNSKTGKPLSFEKMFNLIAFIYYGGMETNDLADFLLAGESLEILGLCRSDRCVTAKKGRNADPHHHTVFVTANGIPADHPLRKTDIHRKVTKKTAARETISSSSLSSASGSEYDVEKDSDVYSGSDDAMPLAKEASRQKLQRSAKLSKTVQPQNNSNAQKRSKAKLKQIPPSQSQSGKPVRANETVQKTVPHRSQAEETVTISKQEYERLLRQLQRNQIDLEQQSMENDSNGIEREQYHYDEDLEEAGDESEPQHCDDSTYQDYECEQFEYDDDGEILEGAVGGSMAPQLDENHNALIEAGKGKDGENQKEDNDDQQQDAVPVKGKFGGARDWTDDDYVDEAIITTGKRGGPLLIHNGYEYQRSPNSRQADDYIRWVCKRRRAPRCNVLTKSKEIDGVTMVQKPSKEHNHPPDYQM